MNIKSGRLYRLRNTAWLGSESHSPGHTHQAQLYAPIAVNSHTAPMLTSTPLWRHVEIGTPHLLTHCARSAMCIMIESLILADGNILDNSPNRQIKFFAKFSGYMVQPFNTVASNWT